MTTTAKANTPRRFRLNGKVYEVPPWNAISLKEIIQFDQQAEALGIKTRWDDIEALATMAGSMTKAQAASHPDRYIMFGTTLWFARRAAGEDVSLDEAITVKLSDVEWLADPKDRQPGKKAAAKKAQKKPASSRAKRPATSKASAAGSGDVAESSSPTDEVPAT